MKQKTGGIEGTDLDALGEEVQSLWSAVEIVKGESIRNIHRPEFTANPSPPECQNDLREKRKNLDEVVYLQEKLKTDQSRRNVCAARAGQLGVRVALITPKLQSIANMADAVSALQYGIVCDSC